MTVLLRDPFTIRSPSWNAIPERDTSTYVGAYGSHELFTHNMQLEVTSRKYARCIDTRVVRVHTQQSSQHASSLLPHLPLRVVCTVWHMED